MQIAGIQKTTLIDYPGKVATTIFTRGCSFRCGFCHNPELVLKEKFIPLIEEQEIFNFLESRLGKIQGVCITGGEPTIQPDISEFISHLKALDYAVKLDTNGSMPEVLNKIIKIADIDYVAMDIKAPLENYQMVANPVFRDKYLDKKIKESISLIMNSKIDYEFRTTVCHPYHQPEDFQNITSLIKGAKRYFIQNYTSSKQINPHISFRGFSDFELEKSLQIAKKFVKNSKIR